MTMKQRRFGVLLSVAGIGMAVLAGCSDSSTNTNQATVALQGELVKANVTGAAMKGTSLAHGGEYADSLKITRVRLLISRIKLHGDGPGEKTIKEGPVLIVVEPNAVRAFANAPITAGTYDKIKFEFHRFSTSEISQYLNDTLFADFVTGNRSTAVIEGIVYVDSLAVPFKFTSDMTANLELKFEPAITLDANTTTNVSLVVDVDQIFRERQSTKIHDPRDSRNQSELDNAIRDAIKALKR